jgi:hypothetical protein
MLQFVIPKELWTIHNPKIYSVVNMDTRIKILTYILKSIAKHHKLLHNTLPGM